MFYNTALSSELNEMLNLFNFLIGYPVKIEFVYKI